MANSSDQAILERGILWSRNRAYWHRRVRRKEKDKMGWRELVQSGAPAAHYVVEGMAREVFDGLRVEQVIGQG